MIYHVYSHYRPKDQNTRRRINLAKATWKAQTWEEIPVGDHDVRCYKDHMGVVPFVKDIVNFAAKEKDPSDILVLTNADICVASNCCFKIVGALQSIQAAYCFRRDFGRLTGPLPDESIHKGNHYCGSDLYAFRVGWWNRHKADFPELLMGREAWDAILRILIEMTHPNQNPTLYDLIYHERHASVWENPRNRRTIPSQMHNVRIARDWMLSFGFMPRSIGL